MPLRISAPDPSIVCRPSFIYTEMHASGGEPGRVDRVKDLVPMKLGGQPEEVARDILWLLSDEASYTTGSFIDLAGGEVGRAISAQRMPSKFGPGERPHRPALGRWKQLRWW